MFWDIVGAILFVFIGIPIIIYIVILLLGGSVAILGNKDVQKGCVIIFVIIAACIYLFIDNNNRQSQKYLRDSQADLTAKRQLKQSLRDQNPDKEGYFVLEHFQNASYRAVKNTDGTFTIWRNYLDCSKSLNTYIERYDLEKFNYSCELL